MKRFLDLADFSREQVMELLSLAQSLQDRPDSRALAGKVLGLVFLNPSLRTLASFQSGMAKLGGSSFVIVPGQGTWQLETRVGQRFRIALRAREKPCSCCAIVTREVWSAEVVSSTAATIVAMTPR